MEALQVGQVYAGHPTSSHPGHTITVIGVHDYSDPMAPPENPWVTVRCSCGQTWSFEAREDDA